MKISVDWIGDFVDLPGGLSDRELSERVTLGVCEVEGFERTGGALGGVSVAEVTEVKPHPDADKLSLATVNLGDGQTATVVCGAPNCRKGIKVPYAPVGTTLPGGFTLTPKKIRGIMSEGMLCAEDELGISDAHEGLMELPPDAPVGKPITAVLGDEPEDLILDVDNKSLTHRPDCWGHYGLAREFAAVFQTPFKDKFNTQWAEKIKKRIADDGGKAPVTIHVDKDSANLGFLGLTVDGVKVEESPRWMQRRLLAAGMRPINSIVDISNYAMLEVGIPNHIFDCTTIRGGEIHVRRAGSEEVFVTLDGQERKLIASDTLVCDAERPSAIAGVMGGMDSSVADGTTRIMIEAANWVDAEVRRTGTRLGLRTDALQRYEKSLDSRQLEKVLLRIFELVCELNPGARAVGGIQSDNMNLAEEPVILTGPERVSAVLGTPVEEARFRKILETLGFGVEALGGAAGTGAPGKGGALSVVEPGGGAKAVAAGAESAETLPACTHKITVPSWRATKDVECEADIVEEIGRIIGYDNITPQPPVHGIEALRLSPGKVMMRRIRDYMVLRGKALEVMTYPLIGLGLLERADWPVHNDNLVLANALTPDHDRMRPSLIPSLVQTAAENRKEHEAFKFFECGRSYTDLGGEKFSEDRYQMGVVFQENRANPFVELADAVEGLLGYLELPGQLVPGNPAAEHPLVPADWPGSHPHEFLDVRIMGTSRGVVFSLHPQVARAFKLKGRTALAVLDVTDVMNRPAKKKEAFRSLDRFPGSDFDLTVVADAHVHAEDVVAVVRRLKLKEIRRVGVRDVFRMEDGQKALTLQVHFRDSEKTLEPDFIKGAEEKIIQVLDKAGYPLKV